MLYIFVDLEMNPVDSVHVEEHKICSTEIIEIGAVMLDDGFKEIDSFKKFVKPKYSANISSICRSLTGIRDENLAGAGGFNDAMEDFIAWCLGHGEEYRIYSWSDSDRLQICTEMKLKGYDKSEYTEYMLRNWEDFQKEYDRLIGVKQPVSLNRALISAGLEFTGKMHDALCDARNTSILFGMSRNREEFLSSTKKIREAINGNGKTVYKLGDMIDFDKLSSELNDS